MKNLLLVEWLYYISTPIRAYSKVKSTHKQFFRLKRYNVAYLSWCTCVVAAKFTTLN